MTFLTERILREARAPFNEGRRSAKGDGACEAHNVSIRFDQDRFVSFSGRRAAEGSRVTARIGQASPPPERLRHGIRQVNAPAAGQRRRSVKENAHTRLRVAVIMVPGY